MSILITLLLVVEVIAAFLLVVIILAQKSKDQGLGMAFGSGMGESLFGSRAGNVLTRMTITLAIVFMVTTIVLGMLFSRGKSASGSVMDAAGSAPVPVPMQAQGPMGAPSAELPPMSELPPMMDLPPEVAQSAPIAFQMGTDGKLIELTEVPVVEAPEAAPAAEAAPEAEGEQP